MGIRRSGGQAVHCGAADPPCGDNDMVPMDKRALPGTRPRRRAEGPMPHQIGGAIHAFAVCRVDNGPLVTSCDRAMTLLHSTLIMLTISCGLMLIGFSARDKSWGPGLIMLGIVGSLVLIAYNIFQLTPAR